MPYTPIVDFCWGAGDRNLHCRGVDPCQAAILLLLDPSKHIKIFKVVKATIK